MHARHLGAWFIQLQNYIRTIDNIICHLQKYFEGITPHFQIIHNAFNTDFAIITLLACLVFTWALLLQLKITKAPLTYIPSSLYVPSEVALFCIPGYLFNLQFLDFCMKYVRPVYPRVFCLQNRGNTIT